MKKISAVKVFCIVCGLSLALFLVTCWSAIYPDSTPYWVESVGYFMLTYFCLDICRKRTPDIPMWSVISALIFGRILIEIPIRIYDWDGCKGSVMITASCIIAILMSAYCHKLKKPFAFILSYLILALFNSVVADSWSRYVLDQWYL